ncbi:hypothetical protein [Actinomadura terrae]|uniref:hypothetical protein n=1 Tax=Actinomadura terrae TaxID=604353 RepID=UPI001FA7BDA0|nr:hypothetical protein [Actinomadura terrae]
MSVAVGAVCASPLPGYHIAPGPVGQNVAGSARQQATCAQPGTVPLGVGGNSAGQPRLGLSALYIDQANGAYRANVAINQSPAGGNSVQAIVVCAAPPTGYELVTSPLRTSVPSYSKVPIACPSGKTIVSGGLSIPGTYSYISQINPSSVSGYWEASAFTPPAATASTVPPPAPSAPPDLNTPRGSGTPTPQCPAPSESPALGAGCPGRAARRSGPRGGSARNDQRDLLRPHGAETAGPHLTPDHRDVEEVEAFTVDDLGA